MKTIHASNILQSWFLIYYNLFTDLQLAKVIESGQSHKFWYYSIWKGFEKEINKVTVLQRREMYKQYVSILNKKGKFQVSPSVFSLVYSSLISFIKDWCSCFNCLFSLQSLLHRLQNHDKIQKFAELFQTWPLSSSARVSYSQCNRQAYFTRQVVTHLLLLHTCSWKLIPNRVTWHQ